MNEEVAKKQPPVWKEKSSGVEVAIFAFKDGDKENLSIGVSRSFRNANTGKLETTHFLRPHHLLVVARLLNDAWGVAQARREASHRLQHEEEATETDEVMANWS